MDDRSRLIAQAGQALQANDGPRARRILSDVTAGSGAPVAAWLYLARAELACGDEAAALAALDSVLTREPRHIEGLLLKADILAHQADLPASSSYYRAALMAAQSLRAPIAPHIQAHLRRAQSALRDQAAAYERQLRDTLSARGIETGDTRFGHAVDILLGRRQVFAQQPRNFLFPYLSQVQFSARDEHPWLDGLEAAAADIREELLTILERDEGAFKPYVEGAFNRPANDFQGLLNDPSWSAFYLWKNGEPVVENIARCPKTMRALEDVPLARIANRSPSILFSLLRPGAHIPPHTGLINTRFICHLPLIVPDSCQFRVGNEVRKWEVDRAWVFDDTIEHEAWNRGTETRVVLLFDIWKPELTPAERDAVSCLFEAIDQFSGRKPDWEI